MDAPRRLCNGCLGDVGGRQNSCLPNHLPRPLPSPDLPQLPLSHTIYPFPDLSRPRPPTPFHHTHTQPHTNHTPTAPPPHNHHNRHKITTPQSHEHNNHHIHKHTWHTPHTTTHIITRDRDRESERETETDGERERQRHSQMTDLCWIHLNCVWRKGLGVSPSVQATRPHVFSYGRVAGTHGDVLNVH